MAWGQAIATTAGGAGNAYGRAVDSNINTALAVIQNKLVAAEIQQRMREQDLRMKQMQQPIPQGTYQTPQGIYGATFDPNTGKYGGGLIPGTQQPPAPKIDPQAVESLIGTLPKEKQDTVRKLLPIWMATGQDLPSIVKFLQQEALKETPAKPPDTFQQKRTQAEADALALGFKPGTKAYIEKVNELANPATTKIFNPAGGGGGDSSELALKAQMVMNGTPIEKVSTPKTLGKLLKYMHDNGMTPPIPLTTEAQKTLQESSPVHEQIQSLMAQFAPLKDDNTSFKYFRQRLEYSMGRQTPIAGAADTIAQLELNRVVGAARVMKGSSRAVGMLQKAMIHLPDVWVDSPKMIYYKLDNLDKALTQIETDAVKYGKKGGITTQSTQDLINNLPLAPSHQ